MTLAMWRSLIIVIALLIAVSAEAQEVVGVRMGLGHGSYSNFRDVNCRRLIGDRDIKCKRTDTGLMGTIGVDARWRKTDRVDVALRADVTTLRMHIEGLLVASKAGIRDVSVARGSGYAVTIGAEAGVRATPEARFYGGAGLSPFTFDNRLAITSFGRQEAKNFGYSSVGRTMWGGLDCQLNGRLSVVGEISRTWLTDDGHGSGDAVTSVIAGIRFGFSK